MGCVAIGAMFSLAVFLAPMSAETGWSRAGISFAMTINFLVMAFGSFGWGAASDRWGARIVTLIGAVLLGLALVLASRATTLLAFSSPTACSSGLSASAFFAPMIATVTGWFETRRNLAVSLVSAGMGMAPLTISPLASWLITHYGWRAAMFYIGVLAWVLVIPAALFVRRPPVARRHGCAIDDRREARQGDGRPGAHLAAVPDSGFHVLPLLRRSLGAHLPRRELRDVVRARLDGGRERLQRRRARRTRRPAAARVCSRIATARSACWSRRSLTQALAIAAYLKVNELDEFYALAVIFGVAYGGGMPLYASLARDYFGQHIMGTVFGAATMLSSLGMAFGPVAGGWVFDTFNNYAWLYIGSAAVAVGAVLLALLFPKPEPIRA